MKDKLVSAVICMNKNYSIKKQFCKLTRRKINANIIILKFYSTDKIYNKAQNIKYIWQSQHHIFNNSINFLFAKLYYFLSYIANN